MEITGKLSLELQYEDAFSFRNEDIDCQYYIIVKEDSDEDNTTQETTSTEALEISNSHYYSTILSNQAPNSIHINTNSVDHMGPVRTNTYPDAINVRTLNQEIPVMSVSKQN